MTGPDNRTGMTEPGADGSNHDARRVLFDAIDRGTLAHTVLLSGPAGAGKRALAFACAERLLKDPYGRALRGEHPDLCVWDYADAAFKVEYAREIRLEAAKSPTEADTRVFVLMHAQNMTPGAQNALLKLLEEPVGYFFLLCENESAILDTVRSRCLKLETQPPAEEAALAALQARFPDADAAALRRILQDAGGYPETAAALFERGSSPEATELAGIADTILDRAEAGDELGLWRAVLQKERLSRDDCTLLLDLLAQRLIDRAEGGDSSPALARLSGLVSEMQALVSRNVSPAHVLGLFSRLFAG